MTEVYAFLAALAVQILALSVLHPSWFTRYWRTQLGRVSAERLAELYPGTDVSGELLRFAARYRALNALIAALGVLLLGWLFRYMQRPDWSDGPVETLVSVYFFLQVLPLGLVVWVALRRNLLFATSRERKRTAQLERRRLFDFVSPLAVVLALLGYVAFVLFVARIQQRPFAGFAGALLNIGVVTLLYALNAVVVYATLYGKRLNTLETHALRVQRIALTVKSCVYSCIACVAFLSLNFSLVLLDLQRWEPFALSVFFVICALICMMGLAPPVRQPE